MSPSWIHNNPDGIIWPKGDANLRLEVHSYDPYNFCLENPPSEKTWGTPADVTVINEMYGNLTTWSKAHGNIPGRW